MPRSRLALAQRTLRTMTNGLRSSRLGDSTVGAKLIGYRGFVGGRWDVMGERQYRLLLDHGLQPYDVLMDVGCGSLRAGRLFIPYLEPGHYIGVDKHRDLINRGLKHEVAPGVAAEKRPRFVITDRFEIPREPPLATFALAQSLFSHLNDDDAKRCLAAVRAAVDPGCRFLVTFMESARPVANQRSHSHRGMFFTSDEMREMGIDNGWSYEYVGPWNHPGGQRLVIYTAMAHVHRGHHVVRGAEQGANTERS